jgi:hypothetical protein
LLSLGHSPHNKYLLHILIDLNLFSIITPSGAYLEIYNGGGEQKCTKYVITQISLKKKNNLYYMLFLY